MKARSRLISKRALSSPEDRAAYWLQKSPEERVKAVGLINLTILGEKYAQQKFSRVCRITRGSKG